MEWSKLVCTPGDLTNLKEKLQNLEFIDFCKQDTVKIKWKIYKLTNLTVFAALLKDVPMGCEDSALPELLLENQNVNCLTSKKIQESLTMTIYAFPEQLLSIYLTTKNWRRKHPKISNF